MILPLSRLAILHNIQCVPHREQPVLVFKSQSVTFDWRFNLE